MGLFEIEVPSGQSNEDLQLFRYAFSHDLKVALRPILGLGHYLSEGEVSEARGNQYHSQVTESARQLERQFDALSEYARLCLRATRHQKVELKPLLQAATRQQLARLGRAEECVEMSGDFPAVRADLASLKIVFSELIANALQFARPGQPPRVLIRANSRESQVETLIQDFGLGIPQDCLTLLGKPFQKFHSGAGVGFGFTLVLRALSLARGRLRCASHCGEGSTFVVSLEAV
jgi:light-regulated signal transduction histidine kinase (bacteriophytochrome)